MSGGGGGRVLLGGLPGAGVDVDGGQEGVDLLGTLTAEPGQPGVEEEIAP